MTNIDYRAGQLTATDTIQVVTIAGIRDGTRFGKGCMQASSPPLYRREELSEDCLTLDVYTPVNVSGDERYYANKAVMVWIHGGGFLSGTSELFESKDAFEFRRRYTMSGIFRVYSVSFGQRAR